MANSLQNAFQENVRPFIDIIDELRSLGLDKDVPLPAVVVVGDQSAGKSSVLEAISGVELPRGTNIVTRCPLELRLRNLRQKKVSELLEGEEEVESLARWRGLISYQLEESGELVKEVLESPSEVGAAVEKATEFLTKGTKEISHHLIRLDVHSETVPDLTLIDLPGIARVAVEGQSADVPAHIKALIKQYIQREEVIILTVVPCNVDIATTEALQLAQQVDPEGTRTIGVLTKPDLMDEGTEGIVRNIVYGEKVKLRLGYTVVKCRGQRAIENNVPLQEAVRIEENFFKSHDVFRILYQDKKTGVHNLSRQLTKQLVEQIKTHLPELRNDINAKLYDVNVELEIYGEGIPEDDHERRNYLFEILMKLGELLKKLARAEHYEDESTNTLRLYTRVKNEFEQLSNEIRQMKPQRNNDILKNGVTKDIKRLRGKELPSFLSFSVFEEIVRQQVKKIESPAKVCLRKVNSIVEVTAATAIKESLARFEPLLMEVNRLMNDERKRAEENTYSALNTIFAMENLVFTQDQNFTRFMKIIEEEDNEEEEKNPTGSPKGIIRSLTLWMENGEKMDTEYMVKCLEAYCEVATTRLVDTIPMTLYYHLVKQLLERLATEIVKIAVRPNAHNDLLKEDPEIVFARKMLSEKQERLEKASMKLIKFGASSSTPTVGAHHEGEDDEFIDAVA